MNGKLFYYVRNSNKLFQGKTIRAKMTFFGDKTSRAKNLSKAACSAVNSKIGNQPNIIKIFL